MGAAMGSARRLSFGPSWLLGNHRYLGVEVDDALEISEQTEV
jgi:hypothetical protein